MNHHCKPPAPMSFLLAGGACAVGLVAIIARVIHGFTPFTLREPFNTITFIVAAIYALAGPFLGAWFVTQKHKDDAVLRDEEIDRIATRLEDAVRNTPPSVHYLPARAREGQQWPIAVGGQGDATPMPTGLDPETVAAVHRIGRRLRRGDPGHGR